MPLRVICGGVGSGKTRLAIDAFLTALDAGKNPVFIAPSQPDARHFERQILAARSLITGGKITTFNNLGRDILSGGKLRRRVIERSERLTLIRAVIDGNPGLRALGASSVYAGFVTSLGELFSEFGQLGIAPGNMQQTLTPWSTGNKWREDLVRDIFSLYQEYHAQLEQLAAWDAEQAGQAAVSLLGQPDFSLAHGAVIIDGFWDFTPQQHQLIQALEAKIDEVTVTLPFEAGKPAYAAPGYHLDRLAGGLEPEFLLPRDDAHAAPALGHIVTNLFEEKITPSPAVDGITMLTAAGSRGQAEQIAAEILKLWRGGQSLDDVAVVARSLERDLLDVAGALAKMGVPYDLPAPVPLNRTPVGVSAKAALDFAANINCRDNLMTFLRAGLAGEPRADIDIFDRFIRLHGVEEQSDLLHTWLDECGWPLTGLEDLKAAYQLGAEACTAGLCRMLSRLVAENCAADAAGPDTLGIDVLALGNLQTICDETVSVLRAQEEMEAVASAGSDEAGSAGEGGRSGSSAAARLIKLGIDTAAIRLPGAQRRGCVRLLDPHRVLNQRFDVIFVCGLLEKQFPSLGREDAFFSDADRRKLASDHNLAMRDRERRLDEERFLFHRTVSRARHRLYLCHPYCDKEGKPTVRSLFVDDLLELFESETIKPDTRDIGDVAFAVARVPTPAEALKSLALIGGADGGERINADVLAVAQQAGVKERLLACQEAAYFRAPAITDSRLQAILKDQEEFAVTELQKYLKCPFRYFVETLLAPAGMEPAAHGMRRGQVVHKILCHFGEMLRRLQLSLPDASEEQLKELRRQMQALLEEEFAEAGSDLETVILKTELAEHLDRFIEREKNSQRHFLVYDVEVSFGSDRQRRCGGKESTGQMLNFGGVRLSGRIDRIDWAGDRNLAMIVDYKASRTVTSQRDFEKEKEIQIPLYMEALENIFGLKAIAGEYYAIQADRRAGLYLQDHREELGSASGQIKAKDFVDADDFAARLHSAQEMALTAVKGIQAAQFPLEPTGRQCDWCGLGDVCRNVEDRPAGASEDD